MLTNRGIFIRGSKLSNIEYSRHFEEKITSSSSMLPCRKTRVYPLTVLLPNLLSLFLLFSLPLSMLSKYNYFTSVIIIRRDQLNELQYFGCSSCTFHLLTWPQIPRVMPMNRFTSHLAQTKVENITKDTQRRKRHS